MRIAVLQERAAGERRVAATPETVKKFCALGATVTVERGAGEEASISDAAYEEAGAALGQAEEVVRGADIVLGVPPHQRIVFGVGNLRRVVGVVELVMASDRRL